MKSWGRSNVAEVEAQRESESCCPCPPRPPDRRSEAATTTTTREAARVPPSAASPAPTVSPLPMPPAAAARALCVSLLPRLMPMAIDDASHWTVRGRRRAVWLLCFLVRYAGEDVTPYMPQLLSSLGEASRY